MVWSYLQGVFTRPGYPDETSLDISQSRFLSFSSYQPLSQHYSQTIEMPSTNQGTTDSNQTNSGSNDANNNNSVRTITVKQNGEKRFCKKCQSFKPDRTHHCRAILELDLNWSFLILVGAIFALCLSGFTIYHTTLILSNQTTLENLQQQRYKIKENSEVTSNKYLNLFDIGKRANFLQVMGSKWYIWLIPIGSSHGNGHLWPLNSYQYSTLCDSVENLNENRV
ncbi:1334_t:CDS:2 [Ambispora gerdemannii]|uniref:1334_t:CDS:1 n=1 Tax=Ambispora gerdemannii TaxID=144530 RepID=A0A9N9CFA7_9GLOM|nr:1334_t:CDS:2 [Ambispora gerdemannii]